MRREKPYHLRGSDLGWESLIRFAICITLFVWISARDSGVRLYQVLGQPGTQTRHTNICPRIGHWESLGVRQEASQVGTWDTGQVDTESKSWHLIDHCQWKDTEHWQSRSLQDSGRCTSGSLSAQSSRQSMNGLCLTISGQDLSIWECDKCDICIVYRDTSWHPRDQVRRNIGLLSHKEWSLSSQFRRSLANAGLFLLCIPVTRVGKFNLLDS